MRVNSSREAWVRRFHAADDAAAVLLCLPHAGGSASYFYPMSAALSPRIDVCAVQYPGRQDRRAEPCIDDISCLADAIFVALREEADERPVVLFGHSMGATVGFELARRLTAVGRAPAALMVSARTAPTRNVDHGVHRLSDAGVVAEIGKLNGTSGALLDDAELLSMILPSIRADYRAVETYQCAPGAHVNCPIIALTGDADPKTTVSDAGAWAVHTTGGFELKLFPGGHFYLQDGANRDAVADVVREVIKSNTAAGVPA
jgi:surfactin synthase thioesterase subunit